MSYERTSRAIRACAAWDMWIHAAYTRPDPADMGEAYYDRFMELLWRSQGAIV